MRLTCQTSSRVAGNLPKCSCLRKTNGLGYTPKLDRSWKRNLENVFIALLTALFQHLNKIIYYVSMFFLFCFFFFFGGGGVHNIVSVFPRASHAFSMSGSPCEDLIGLRALSKLEMAKNCSLQNWVVNS